MMTLREQHVLRTFEGRRVSMALTDGSRLDDVLLVSAGRSAIDSVWIYWNGSDRFIPGGDITSVWERPRR